MTSAASSGSLLLVRTLGELRVLRDGEEVATLRSRPLLQALLCYLAVERSASRDRLLSLFWEGRDPEKGRHALSQALYTLRKALGQHWIESDSRGLSVNQLLWTDLADFDRDLERGDPAAALARYDGPFLDGFISDSPAFEHWASGQRATVDRALREVFRTVVDSTAARGDLPRAIATARAWLGLDPADDEANHKLIELLATSGSRTDALRQYELYRRVLAEDDLAPLDQTEELVDAIRKDELHVTPVPSDPSSPVILEIAPAARADSSQTEVPGAEGAPFHATAPTQERDSDPDDDVVVSVAAPPFRTTLIWSGAASRGPRLVRIVERGEEAEAYPLSGRRTVIGRLEGDLVFPDDGLLDVVHASFLVRSTGPDDASGDRFLVRDEASQGGVFVDIRGAWPLRPGDVFAVGRQRFRVDVDHPSAPGRSGP